MENIVLTIHLLLALGLILTVLMQRSEGGGLGIGGGGGGGGGGVMSGRSAATALSKVTWVLAIGFLITSLTLTVLATMSSSGGSVLSTGGALTPAEAEEIQLPPALEGDLLPPSNADAPAAPPAAE